MKKKLNLLWNLKFNFFSVAERPLTFFAYFLNAKKVGRRRLVIVPATAGEMCIRDRGTAAAVAYHSLFLSFRLCGTRSPACFVIRIHSTSLSSRGDVYKRQGRTPAALPPPFRCTKPGRTFAGGAFAWLRRPAPPRFQLGFACKTGARGRGLAPCLLYTSLRALAQNVHQLFYGAAPCRAACHAAQHIVQQAGFVQPLSLIHI